MPGVAAETIVERSGVKPQRIDIVVARSRPNRKVTAVRRQVGLGLIGPKRIEAFADDVVANRFPEPASGFGIGGVDVRSGPVIRKSVCGGAVGEVLEPSFLQNEIVIAGLWNKARPHADHGLEAHVMQLAVHGGWIRPLFRNKIHLTHFCVIEPIHHQDIGGQMAFARYPLATASSSSCEE